MFIGRVGCFFVIRDCYMDTYLQLRNPYSPQEPCNHYIICPTTAGLEITVWHGLIPAISKIQQLVAVLQWRFMQQKHRPWRQDYKKLPALQWNHSKYNYSRHSENFKDLASLVPTLFSQSNSNILVSIKQLFLIKQILAFSSLLARGFCGIVLDNRKEQKFYLSLSKEADNSEWQITQCVK